MNKDDHALPERRRLRLVRPTATETPTAVIADKSDDAFNGWVRTTPTFVIVAMCDLADGLHVNPDALRLSEPHVARLREILAT